MSEKGGDNATEPPARRRDGCAAIINMMFFQYVQPDRRQNMP
jgi:hypothetical protein